MVILFISFVSVYILIKEINDCSEAGRREDLYADEEGTESFAS